MDPLGAFRNGRISESSDQALGSPKTIARPIACLARGKRTYHFRKLLFSETLYRGASALRSADRPKAHSFDPMTHSQLVEAAVSWLRSQYRCGIVLSEQSCASGETPDVIGWKGKNHSVVVECKISRADFFVDGSKVWRIRPESALGCERFYLAPAQMISGHELPAGWGLLEISGRTIRVARKSKKNLRGAEGLANEMNLLLASLRRVEVRIEPQTITDFLKWKNRMARYNGGTLPIGIVSDEEERNTYLA